MSKAEYKRLLKMEIEQLDTCRETSHMDVDELLRKSDSDFLIVIARDRIDVGLDLPMEDKVSVERELGL